MRFFAVIAASVAVASAAEFEWSKIARAVVNEAQDGQIQVRQAPYPAGNGTGPGATGTATVGPTGTGSPTGTSPPQVTTNAASGLVGPAAAGLVGLVGLLAL